ncbi:MULTISPECIES: sigma-54-dependent transcriptional regulator [Geobacter]|uniref:sigma-54-dependent transcriptional regulator n=1 Tax=Geobacter TaxID=28231 RepID=UPI002573CBB9|nr:sigma-54 dependent transcriptional regulator [Geobacter sulfurreducens]BEH08811.1 sigma-54 dependent transcriptional regulator [Geobacter sulfurreducens subsp. ethanolicus]BET60311.1 sigma-54 dependent transcriptional regulator [Geobacter sp. 60473]HML77719.1 sigma-54 dependent transcriptional regulator [Geobacter sulfurreducens]
MRDTEVFPILLVDDEEEILFTASVTLRSCGFSSVVTESDSRRVMDILARQEVALIILDLYMPHLPGYDLLREIVANYPQIPVIVVTAANEVDMAVQCMKSGAFDYFVKPVEEARLLASVRRAMEMRALRGEVDSLRAYILSGRLEHEEAFAPILTRSPRMRSVFQYLEAVAGSPQPVLVCGETGVGKELVARAIHRVSGRKGQFVAVNIAGLDDVVLSDTLFGHRRGAFTGADRDREGLLAQAAGGTLFLDEIGDLGAASQVKLLRLLQEQEYYPLGADTPRASRARIIAATNRDLPHLIEENAFRRDLYYRLRAHAVQIPPLRERKEDIPLLVDHFLDGAADVLGKRKPTPPDELYGYLATYDFPGNVRELQAMVYDAVARHGGKMLSIDSFLDAMGAGRSGRPSCALQELATSIGFGDRIPTLREAEEALTAQALARAGGNQGIAASYLGISRQALNKRLSRRCGD